MSDAIPNADTVKTTREVLRFSGSFSATEALEISGVSADTLATWYKRELLPENDFEETSPGHGHRRRYSITQIVVLATAKALIDSGVSVKAAMAFASTSQDQIDEGVVRARQISDVIRDMFYSVSDLPPAEAAGKLGEWEHPWVAVWKLPPGAVVSGIEISTNHGFGLMEVWETDDQKGLRDWMRKMMTSSITIIDMPALVVAILKRAMIAQSL